MKSQVDGEDRRKLIARLTAKGEAVIKREYELNLVKFRAVFRPLLQRSCRASRHSCTVSERRSPHLLNPSNFCVRLCGRFRSRHFFDIPLSCSTVAHLSSQQMRGDYGRCPQEGSAHRPDAGTCALSQASIF